MITDTILEQNTDIVDDFKEPSKFKVVVCNDDVTPVEFVVSLLITVFRHNQTAALELTMKIHNEGSAIAGIYSHEIAEQKGCDATTISRNHGYPLLIKVEPE